MFGGFYARDIEDIRTILFPSAELLLLRFADALHDFIAAINRNNSSARHAVAEMKL